MTVPRRIASLLLAVALALGGAASAAPGSGDLDRLKVGKQCGDFLAEMDAKPAGAMFVDCSSHPDWQGKPLRAVYHVDGRDAVAVETAMTAAFGLERLRLLCCHWEAPTRSFRLVDGRDASLAMASDETLVTSRADWADIAAFEIVVDVFTEEI